MGEAIKTFSISVVIPAYNASRTIVRTLDSINNQTRRNLICEVIVINDGSTDDTAELVKEYAKEHDHLNIRLLNKNNGGVSSARNLGLNEAKGTWIGLCDSDDEWLENKLEVQYSIIKEHPSIDFLGGNHTNQTLKILGKKIEYLHKATLKELCVKMYPQTSTVIFKKSIFDEIGGYDESRRYCEDGQFFMKICGNYEYYYHPERIVDFDGGKRGFGGSGLSGNLKGMQDGTRKNIGELYQQKKIDFFFYILINLFIEAKYLRRCLICRMDR